MAPGDERLREAAELALLNARMRLSCLPAVQETQPEQEDPSIADPPQYNQCSGSCNWNTGRL